MAAISPPAPSKPVVIPTRTKSGRRQNKGCVGGEIVTEDRRVSHDSRTVSPSAFAFRAITSPRESKQWTKARPHPKSHTSHTDEETAEVGDSEPSSASSPHSWRMLLSPPQEMDEDEDTMGHLSSMRSLSSESMPSLDTDTESAYMSSSPSTPGFLSSGHGSREKRSKNMSSSVPEDCKTDHPLLVVHPEEEQAAESSAPEFDAVEAGLSSSIRPDLRSNLTASFRRLKFAAKTLTSLSTTTAPAEEVSAHPTLSSSPPFRDERRPLPWAEPPDPALRRYLNPITVSPAEFYTHHERSDRNLRPGNCLASIQLQTYRPGARKSEKASAPPVFLAASPTSTAVNEPAMSASPRQREPRENSDFLRVIVLEMNMRKSGKLSDGAPGRARLWLPARQMQARSDDDADKRNETGRRWMAMSPS
ncbi:MAG: hypothetical protein L6R40_003374 [Gallowayella cf. fulva]|nr:MAG: hypothetical protein L6R40_003374 [Xanthomendoza cf. fulva]